MSRPAVLGLAVLAVALSGCSVDPVVDVEATNASSADVLVAYYLPDTLDQHVYALPAGASGYFSNPGPGDRYVVQVFNLECEPLGSTFPAPRMGAVAVTVSADGVQARQVDMPTDFSQMRQLDASDRCPSVTGAPPAP
jgi:hypothetical protein